MGYLIDDSVLIDFERQQTDLQARIKGREEEAFFLSVISASELLHGVHRAIDPHIKARRSAFVEAVLDRFPILSIYLSIARQHARLWADMKSRVRSSVFMTAGWPPPAWHTD
jgi:tRNA(fMet)-specific endonuclease VapC